MADCVRMSTATVFQLADQPWAKLATTIRTGLPADSFTQIATALNLSQETLASKLGLAPRTLNRKKAARQNLSAEESEKVLRVARIRNLARDLFTTDDAISQWLSTPAPALGHVPPIDLLDTDVGAMEVEGLIRGLAYGNFQ